MDEDSSTTMDDDDRDDFLGNGGAGVLSLATAEDEPPHSIPVSYGYDAVEETFYFRLALGPDWSKDDLSGRAATFVTFGRGDRGGHGRPGERRAGGRPDDVDSESDEADERWRSVVASGRLVDVEEDEVATESLAGLERVDIPLVDMFGAPPADVTFDFLRLDPDELTAREESRTDV